MDETVRALVAGPNYASLATVNEDGSPDVVPVWIGLDGDRLVFFTQTTTRKARNLERDPRLALTVLDHEQPYRSAFVRGRIVERRTDEGIWETIDALARTYTGEPLPWRSETSVLCVVAVDASRFRELPFRHDPGA